MTTDVRIAEVQLYEAKRRNATAPSHPDCRSKLQSFYLGNMRCIRLKWLLRDWGLGSASNSQALLCLSGHASITEESCCSCSPTPGPHSLSTSSEPIDSCFEFNIFFGT
ncbi:uncharacterized protein [Periplaneta americana]|uniref:uncharacterized protein n=1 Tax=Periplaneta americana TaxID=6978 RepID=UPI0037E98385